MHTIKPILFVAPAMLLFACEPQGASLKPAQNTSAVAPQAHQEQPAPAQAAPPQAAPSCQPYEELAKMDTRRPVPLQPMMAWHQKQNMMDHLVAIQQITAHLATEDWDQIVAASKKIESSPQMQQMCQHMGAGAEGFTELALEFHKRADKIGEAATKKDAKAVLAATSHTLEACTSCHATYRQEIVDAQTWQQRTGSDHKPAMQHHHGQH